MEVSQSAYHAFARGASHTPSAKKVALGERVKDVFDRHRRRYGARRVAAQLKAEGIVGWAVDDSMTEELVIKALGKAIASGAIQVGSIIHTDRGGQYVSTHFRALLAAHGCRQSMSRRGNCYDNAMAESFFSRFKAELLEDGIFECVEQARGETFSYIEGYYNRVRRHSALGYKSPEEFERDFKNQEKGSSSESFECGIT